MTNQVKSIDVSKIRRSPYQCRADFDEAKMQELADNIKENGLLQPIVVRSHGQGFELVCGERRLLAFKLNKQEEIPAIVMEYSDKQARLACISENIQRSDLSPVEEIEATVNWIDAYMDEHCEDYRSFLDQELKRIIEVRPKNFLLDLESAVDRGTLFLNLVQSDLRNGTKRVIRKFTDELGKACLSLKRSLDAANFTTNDLPILRKLEPLPEVKTAAINKKLNRRQTKALADLARRDPEKAKEIMDSGMVGDIPLEEASAEDIKFSSLKGLPQANKPETAHKGSYLGIYYANGAISMMEKIPPNDKERQEAFEKVENWLVNHKHRKNKQRKKS